MRENVHIVEIPDPNGHVFERIIDQILQLAYRLEAAESALAAAGIEVPPLGHAEGANKEQIDEEFQRRRAFALQCFARPPGQSVEDFEIQFEEWWSSQGEGDDA